MFIDERATIYHRQVQKFVHAFSRVQGFVLSVFDSQTLNGYIFLNSWLFLVIQMAMNVHEGALQLLFVVQGQWTTNG
jgi:hypothetical protein